MKEAAITSSPHAFVPKEHYSGAEKEELYRTRMDGSFKPYTVIDVITKVYHRDFADDLCGFLGKDPPPRKRADGYWRPDRIWVLECRARHIGALFHQPMKDFCVEIETDTSIKIEEVKVGNADLRNSYKVSMKFWLRYRFDLRPCKLTCEFDGATVCREDTMIAMYPDDIRVDKYLIPVLKPKDYALLAEEMLEDYYPIALEKDVPVDPDVFVRRMGRYLRYAKFPEEGTLGEYFFGFGTADVVDEETGEIKTAFINPGTALINGDGCKNEGSRNNTVMHEAAHGALDTPHFMLQKTHGHDYCSYVCKRFQKAEPKEQLSTIDIMEIQANTLPGYLLIPEKNGRKHAEKLLASYGGRRTLENMRRLVNDMAAYYGTTKHMARTRLMDFGYNEARGITQSANGRAVPSYISRLRNGQSYTISEADALKIYLRDKEFRKEILSGCYVYAEGHYCLNTGKYICRDHIGQPHLTVYAREHMDECCIVFETVYENAVCLIINGILQKGAGKGRKKIEYVRADGSSVITEEGRKLRAMMEARCRDNASLTDNFNQMTRKLMDKRHMTIDSLAEATGLSYDTVKDMRSNPRKVFNIESIVAVCIALHLPRGICKEYINKSPSCFLNTTEMEMYQYALEMWINLSVAEVNRRLVEAGVQPLTNLVEGYDENGVQIV